MVEKRFPLIASVVQRWDPLKFSLFFCYVFITYGVCIYRLCIMRCIFRSLSARNFVYKLDDCNKIFDFCLTPLAVYEIINNTCLLCAHSSLYLTFSRNFVATFLLITLNLLYFAYFFFFYFTYLDLLLPESSRLAYYIAHIVYLYFWLCHTQSQSHIAFNKIHIACFCSNNNNNNKMRAVKLNEIYLYVGNAIQTRKSM